MREAQRDNMERSGVVRGPMRTTSPVWPPVWMRTEAIDGEIKPADVPPLVEVRAEEPPEPTPVQRPWPPRPPELSTWSIHWRQKWGDRFEVYMVQGYDWRSAEIRAFDEIHAEWVAEGRPASGDAVEPGTAPAAPTTPAAPARRAPARGRRRDAQPASLALIL